MKEVLTMKLVDRRSCPTCKHNHSFTDGLGTRWRTCDLDKNPHNCSRYCKATNGSRQNCPHWKNAVPTTEKVRLTCASCGMSEDKEIDAQFTDPERSEPIRHYCDNCIANLNYKGEANGDR